MWSFVVPILLALTALVTIMGKNSLYIANMLGGEKENNSEGQVCYDGLGCFDNDELRPTVLRPVPLIDRPEDCHVNVYFYSRQNLDNASIIKIHPDVLIEGVPFKGNRTTLVVVHGFQRNSSSSWMHRLKTVYLYNVDANVLLVDWMTCAFKHYLQSASNSRLVGRMLSRMLKVLIDQKGLQPELIHLVGHSLGGHVCSYIAKEIPGIGRLTVLELAQPGFEGPNLRVRVDKTDAVFVEVVHTDPKPFFPLLGHGVIGPVGHVDFYFNNGLFQPGCLLPNHNIKINNVDDLLKFPLEYSYIKTMCSHERAHDYLVEAYNTSNSCIFWGHRVNLSSVNFNEGIIGKFKVLSDTCTPSDCLPFGMDTVKTSLRGVFLVTTNGKEPYCRDEPGLVPESSTL